MDLFEEIRLKSGISKEELQQKIDDKKIKFKDLLNDETATFLIAKELGVEIDDSNINIVPLNILDESSKNVNVLVSVKRVGKKNEFEKNNKKGYYYNLVVYDNSKEMSLTIWNQEIDIIPGDIILVKNIYISKFRDGQKLNTSKFSEIKKKGHKEVKYSEKKISELGDRDTGISVQGVIIRKRELNKFEYNGVERSVLRFSLFQDNAIIPVAVWGKISEELNSVSENTKINLINVYTKLNREKKELQVTDESKFEILERDVIVATEPQDTKVSSLAYDKLSKIKIKIKEFVRSYNADVCVVCNSKMDMKDGRFFCNKCNDFKETTKKIVLVYSVEDDSGKTNAVFFTKQSYVLLGADDSNIDDKISNFSGFDTEIFLSGYLKKTQFADEFIVSRVYK